MKKYVVYQANCTESGRGDYYVCGKSFDDLEQAKAFAQSIYDDTKDLGWRNPHGYLDTQVAEVIIEDEFEEIVDIVESYKFEYEWR